MVRRRNPKLPLAAPGWVASALHCLATRLVCCVAAVAAYGVFLPSWSHATPAIAEARAVASAWMAVSVAVASLPDGEPVVTESAWDAVRARLDVLTADAVATASFGLEIRLHMAAASMDLADVEAMEPHLDDAEETETPAGVVRSVTRVPGGAAPANPRDDDEPSAVEQPQRRTVMVAPSAPQPTRRVVVVQQHETGTRGSVTTRTTVVAPAGEVWVHPVSNPRVTSGFGPRTHPVTGQRGRMHRGVDFGGPTGTPVVAPASGRVVAAGWCDRSTGNCIVIDHANGWRSQYFHLSRVDVRPGATVTQGQQIGAIGSTGRSTGPHLHFQVGRDGQAVDPMGLFGRPLLGPR